MCRSYSVLHALEKWTHLCHTIGFEVGTIIIPGPHDSEGLPHDPKTEKSQGQAMHPAVGTVSCHFGGLV